MVSREPNDELVKPPRTSEPPTIDLIRQVLNCIGAGEEMYFNSSELSGLPTFKTLHSACHIRGRCV